MSLTDLETLAREALARAEKATPGPWIIRLGDTGYCRPVVLCKHGGILAELTSHDQVQEDATLMAYARTDVSALANAVLELCERLRKADRFIDELISDFWTGCDDPQSNFALACKHAGCIQCRLIAWRAAKEKA